MIELRTHQLLAIHGGQQAPAYEPNNDALGRVGPGDSVGVLGNYYTPEALAHDQAVRSHVANGSSQLGAHVRALPLLPAAAASWVRARFAPGPNDRNLAP